MLSKISVLEKVSIFINFDTLNSIYMYSISSLEPADDFLPNQYRFTVGRVQDIIEVLVTLISVSRLQ